VSGNKGARLAGRVRDIVQSGEAVLESEQGAVFVRGGLPGERVLISLDPKAKKPLRGRVLSVLEPSVERVDPVCPHVSRCGGCPLMHASLTEQRRLRRGFLQNALRKAGAPAELVVHETLAEHVLAYRRRARLAVKGGRVPVLGYRRERSHTLSDIDSCSVLSPQLAAVLQPLREQLLPHVSGEGELSLALGKADCSVLVARLGDAQTPALYNACAALVERGVFSGIALFASGASMPATFGDPSEWSAGFDGAPLEGALAGFSQAHAEINQALVARVLALCAPKDQKLLELYAGHGNFSVALATEAAQYTAVEHDRGAVSALRRNLAQRGLSAKVVEGDALGYAVPNATDVVLLDPPRAGASGLLTRLAERKVKRIVYVSCDPETLARDLGELLKADKNAYRVSWAEAFEMFPQTADLECVVSLERG
jgi:23S rRNA (uracil1939-C5)-methyltransferase